MIVNIVRLNCNLIRDWKRFHDTFERIFGFPAFYGRNMNAWIDCMTSLDDPTDGMSKIHAAPGEVLILELMNSRGFEAGCPEQYEALVRCCAFVNSSRNEMGQPPVLALSFLF